MKPHPMLKYLKEEAQAGPRLPRRGKRLQADAQADGAGIDHPHAFPKFLRCQPGRVENAAVIAG